MTIPNILKHINKDFFAENSLSDLQELVENGVIEQSLLSSEWLGYKPSSTSEIADLEVRLGTTLPKSYKEFLATSNGFRNISLFKDNLLTADKVNWAKVTEKSWWFDLLEQDIIVSDEEYFNYVQPQDEIKFRGEYFRKSLKISNWYNGMCIFLNPIIKFGDEWEVLEYATWFPGARRYKSFKDFLITTHSDNQERIKNFS
ncbi:MAG: SMI1/KNR4 family protein [Ferruginibacter sp.]